MQKTLLLVALAAAGLSGCSWLKPSPLPVEPEKNPRVVERNLGAAKPTAASKSRIAAKSLANAEPLTASTDSHNAKVVGTEIAQLIKTKAVADSEVKSSASQPPHELPSVATAAVVLGTPPAIAPVKPTPAVKEPFKQQWLIKPEHRSLRDVIEDWASEAGGKGNQEEALDVFFETRDFPLSLKREKVISSGEFWDAMKMLGEAYRYSDAAFQVQPTRFKQIVILPMNKSNGNKVDATK